MIWNSAIKELDSEICDRKSQNNSNKRELEKYKQVSQRLTN
jgi:hypothetical protein